MGGSCTLLLHAAGGCLWQLDQKPILKLKTKCNNMRSGVETCDEKLHNEADRKVHSKCAVENW